MSNPNSLSYLVSNIDITNKIKHKVKIIQYKDLFKYKTLSKLLPNKVSILVILINTSVNGGGHWTVLIRNDKQLIYFDSYGKGVDQELRYVDDEDKQLLHENKPYLSELIKKSKFSLEQNNIAFQKKQKNVDTCGKFVIYLCNGFLSGLNLQEIQNLLIETKKETGISYDKIVTNYFVSI